MKKLDYNHLTTGALTVDASHLIGVVNDLIDLVNSQQEALERLQEHVDHEARHVSEPADDKPEYNFDKFAQEAIEKLESKVWTANFIEKYRPALENLADDTHRTATLRIPKGMTFGWAMIMAYAKSYKHDDWVSFFEQSDTDLQKALDEVQPNE